MVMFLQKKEKSRGLMADVFFLGVDDILTSNMFDLLGPPNLSKADLKFVMLKGTVLSSYNFS
jgi:hypothetical protein